MCKLLIIDDNPLEHLILESMLIDCDVFPAQSHSLDASEALGFIQDNSGDETNLPDIIFLDLNMPNFNGFDFIKGFESVFPSLAKSIDIYIVSSSINTEDISKSKKYPFVKDYFIKPLKKNTLVELYKRYQEKL